MENGEKKWKQFKELETMTRKGYEETKWQPPPHNWVKINVDDSTKKDGASNWGFVISDKSGDVLHADV